MKRPTQKENEIIKINMSNEIIELKKVNRSLLWGMSFLIFFLLVGTIIGDYNAERRFNLSFQQGVNATMHNETFINETYTKGFGDGVKYSSELIKYYAVICQPIIVTDAYDKSYTLIAKECGK